jgi:hypothetical protein
MDIKRWLYTVPLRLRSLFRRARVEAELEGNVSRQNLRNLFVAPPSGGLS